jgi:hypothetical protein
VARKTEEEQQHKNEENHSQDSSRRDSHPKILNRYGDQRDYQESHRHSQHYNNSAAFWPLSITAGGNPSPCLRIVSFLPCGTPSLPPCISLRTSPQKALRRPSGPAVSIPGKSLYIACWLAAFSWNGSSKEEGK